MRYGDVARIGRLQERFEPGSIELREPATLNLEHRRTEPLALLEFTDTGTELRVAATLPAGERQDQALEDVRSGKLSGLSIEFRALSDHVAGGVRTIARAIVAGAALTGSPSYPQTSIEARSLLIEQRASIGTLGSYIPEDEPVTCHCHQSPAKVEVVEFTDGAMWRSVEAAREQDRNVLAAFGDFKTGLLGSTAAGTLRFARGRSRVDVEIDLPDTEAGRDVRELLAASPLLVRPVYDQSKSTFTEQGGVARYTDLWLRAILVGASPDDQGWPAARMLEEQRHRRALAWL